MEFFYDGQIRRYVTQMIRLFSNFKVQNGSGATKIVPVMYGDMTRQVANILRDNSENKLPSAPRMSVYITGLEMDRSRTSDSSFVSKVNVRERAFDENNQEYLNTQGKNYTVERLMPSPYTITFNVDLWASNTEQKLQLLEQILMLFNPSLEIQTTDNFIDWTSLSVVHLENTVFSSRSIPIGVDSEIDVAQLTFSTPIYISPPVKVKRLGVITDIITSIFNEDAGTIDLSLSRPEINRYLDDEETMVSEEDGNRKTVKNSDAVVNINYQDYGVYVSGTSGQLIFRNQIGVRNWRELAGVLPGEYQDGISRLYLKNADTDKTYTGTFTINELNETQIVIDWDTDSFPDDTVIDGPARAVNSQTSIDYIIDPTKSNPSSLKSLGTRILLLGDIGNSANVDGADAWKATNSDDLIANENDIVEWTGSSWQIVFDASETVDVTYTTNLNTGIQYRWTGEEWLLSIDGEYPKGTWRIDLNG